MIAAARMWRRFTKNSFAQIPPNDSAALSSLYFSTSAAKKALRNDLLLEILVNKHHFPPAAASMVASALSHVRNPEKTDAAVSFFKEAGFSTSQLEKVATYRPQFLSASLDRVIKPKIKIFQSLGYSSAELAEMIANDPWLLRRGLNQIIPSIVVLKRLLGSDVEVSRLLRVSGWFLSTDLRKSLEPNVEFLTSCGVPLDRLVSLIFNFPRFLLIDPEHMRRSVLKADEMGVKRSSKMFLHAVRVFSSLTEKTLEMKLQILRDIGFSDKDISRIFKQAPIVLNISEQKIRDVAELVLSTGKYDVSAITTSVTCLCRSIEEWYKPRFGVLEALEGENLLRKWPRFSTLLRMSNEGFVEKYVAPYGDLVVGIYCRNVEKKDKLLASVQREG